MNNSLKEIKLKENKQNNDLIKSLKNTISNHFEHLSSRIDAEIEKENCKNKMFKFLENSTQYQCNECKQQITQHKNNILNLIDTNYREINESLIIAIYKKANINDLKNIIDKYNSQMVFI